MGQSGSHLIRWADQQAVPWQNGGGVTRELAASPVGADATSFDWRVSIADVEQPGPFSRFPGVDRVITMIEGAGMVLEGASGAVTLQPRTPWAFSGDDVLTCRLPQGPTSDLNLMTRRGRVRGTVTIHEAITSASLPRPGRRQLVVALEGDIRLTSDCGERWTLARYDVLDTADELVVAEGTVAGISID